MNLESLWFGKLNQIALTRRCDPNRRGVNIIEAFERAQYSLCVSNDNNEEDKEKGLWVN